MFYYIQRGLLKQKLPALHIPRSGGFPDFSVYLVVSTKYLYHIGSHKGKANSFIRGGSLNGKWTIKSSTITETSIFRTTWGILTINPLPLPLIDFDAYLVQNICTKKV